MPLIASDCLRSQSLRETHPNADGDEGHAAPETAPTRSLALHVLLRADQADLASRVRASFFLVTQV